MKKVLLHTARLSSILCVMATSSAAIAANAAFMASANPALAMLNESITFYASFDGHVTADLSMGNGTPAVGVKKLEYREGVWGRALQGQRQDHILYYDAKDNIDLLQSGSLIIWVAPNGTWTDADDPIELIFSYVRNQGKSLLLGRLPSKEEEQALIAIYGPDVANIKTRSAVKNKDTLYWKTGQWHLLVVNWNLGVVELSVDGSRFSKPIYESPNAPPTDDKREYIGIAANSTAKAPYSVDELMILNRPLTNDEVAALYQSKPEPVGNFSEDLKND